MRLRRFRQAAFECLLMLDGYPGGVYVSRIPPKGTGERSSMSDHQHHAHHGAHEPHQAAGVKDPVCGMTVNPDTAKHRHVHNGQPYYFCSGRCREKFAANPLQYLDPAAGAAEPVVAGAIYTCPMHPEIPQVGPGSCPICGMALEPEMVSADAGPNPELADMSRRLWIGLALAAPVFALEMGGHLFDLHGWIGQQTSNWVQLLLATPVVLWA